MDPEKFMQVEITRIDCCICGIPFWLTEKRRQQLCNSKEIFYCPNGHGQKFCENEADRLRKVIADKNIAILGLERDLRAKCRKQKKQKK